MFSMNLFKKRMEPDFFSKMGGYLGELIENMGKLEGIGLYMKS